MTRTLAVVATMVATVSLAACGTAKPKPNAAQCSDANSAASQVYEVVQQFAGLTSTQDLINADMQLASDPSATGSVDSYAQGLRHAAYGAPSKLASALRQTASDYLALMNEVGAAGASYQSVSQEAGYVLSDIKNVEALCP